MRNGSEVIMPIGNTLRVKTNGKSYSLKRLAWHIYHLLYGTPDLHTHIRWRTIRHFIDFSAASVLDVGCGAGIFSLEYAMRNPLAKVIGIDSSNESISVANSLKDLLNLENVQFMNMDATTRYLFLEGSFDLVLLIDVIEHIPKPEIVIAEVSRVVKHSGNMIISVPTPNYPRVFGYEFHNEIGHLREGYWHADIEKLVKIFNFRIADYKYYTYPPSAMGCALFYRYLRRKKAGLMISPILNLISYFDCLWPIRDRKFACSLVVKAIKEGV